MARYLLVVASMAVWACALVDCLATPRHQVRQLPKAVWLVFIAAFGMVLAGPLAWFAAGRPRADAAGGGAGLHVREDPIDEPAHWIPPDDNLAFLHSLEERLRRRQSGGTDDAPSAV
ncbi:PLD nuclease N-terminal domain-containing protein [Streptomyces sp. RB6PN25]|uniref:PLD nuclease N-terminal domain-containing protein n=1 Tax=Streptomyces humicola TaxID=2953240 RepID=A0ABT1Q201_9ACTN|nr:PLD nuclease N-terminal domain-containing protein [Streptomyces humicola]MCQ4083958.1 PLD nuclease N-terminal domain-containing protein [Streptomyces humicola]